MTDRATGERVRTLIRACEGVAELAAITGKAASSRPDANTDVMVLALWKIRAFIAAPALLRALLDRAEKAERQVLNLTIHGEAVQDADDTLRAQLTALAEKWDIRRHGRHASDYEQGTDDARDECAAVLRQAMEET